jgi:hypothetical protein
MARLATLPQPASRSRNGVQVRALAPRRFLRVLPIRTRPSLFGSD